MNPVKNERGAVIIFVTLMIVILMIMVGLGLDTGQLTYVRNQGQSAVDAAALSAVSALPSRVDSEVKSRAAAHIGDNTYVEGATNKIGDSNVSYVQYDFDTNTITYGGATVANANGVRVALEGGNSITTPVYLTPLLNLLGYNTAATKEINVSAVSVITSKPAIPIVLWENLCPNGTNDPDGNGIAEEQKLLFQHPTNTNTGENSCWTTFLDCSSGASDIKALFEVGKKCSGNEIAGEIVVDKTLICQNRGQVNSVLFEAEKFFKDATDPVYPNHWWLVPVIGGGGNCDPKNPTLVRSWGKIRPYGFETKGDPKYILADVVCGKNLHRELEISLCHSHRLVREPAKGY